MKQLSRFWNRQSLREKFLLIIIPASMLSSVLIMLLAYMIFGEYEQKLYQVARQNLRLMVGKIEKELMEAEDFGVDLATDETVQEALKSERANIRTRRVSMDYIRLAQQVYKVLQKGLAQNRNILSISIFVEDEWYYAGAPNRTYDRSLLSQMEFDSAKASNQMLWCVSQSPSSSLYGIRPIKDMYYGTFKNEAVLVLEYDLEGRLNSMRQDPEDVHLMQEFAIYNGEEVIYSDISPDSRLEWEKDLDYKIVTADNRTFFASYFHESAYGWKYVFLVDYDDLFGAMRVLKYLFCLVAVIVVGISILYCRKLSKLITDRFGWLLSRMKRVEQGSFSVEQGSFLTEQGVSPYPQDEIDLLCQQFEDMVGALDKLIQDNYVKQMLLQENQLKVLQNQINPHFLFNTLQTINWKAKANRQKEISEITESLGKLLRYTLEKEDDPVPLSKELNVLKSYVLIQQVRYEERLVVNLAIPKFMESKPVPKLALQNLVENSIKYALENMLEPCVITVGARQAEDGYQILVEDNGPGIDIPGIGKGQVGISGGAGQPGKILEKDSGAGQPEKIPEKDSEAGQPERILEKDGQAGLRIGLKNIRERIRILFPEGSGLEMINTGHGTLARITVREACPKAKGR